jgi:hypothetical protein
VSPPKADRSGIKPLSEATASQAVEYLQIATECEALEALTVNGLRLGYFEDAINHVRKDAFVC